MAVLRIGLSILPFFATALFPSFPFDLGPSSKEEPFPSKTPSGEHGSRIKRSISVDQRQRSLTRRRDNGSVSGASLALDWQPRAVACSRGQPLEKTRAAVLLFKV